MVRRISIDFLTIALLYIIYCMEGILMGGVVVFTLFTLVSYFLFILKIPFLIIPLTLISIFFGIKPLIKKVKRIKIRFNLQTVLIIIVFILGIAGQLAVISPSGIFQNEDLVFWSSHGHDATWHIALMEEFKRGFPFENPSFAGEKLVNYHFFSDIAPAIISKYFPVNNLDLYFRIFPFLYSLFLGASAYFLTKKLTNNFSASIWAVVFTYFAGSFGYLIGKGESVFWATQPQSSSGNPPQIVSNFLFLATLYFVLVLTKKSSKLTWAICILLLGTLASFKVYAGAVLLLSIFLAGIWQVLRERKFQLLVLSIVSGVLTAILYFPNTSGSTSFLIFEPWWYIRTMIVEPSRLNLLDWELRRQTYIYEHNWKRVIWLEGLGLLIFFFGNLGMRLIGLWDFLKQTKESIKNYFSLVFISVILLSFILPLLFLQKGVASNTSQFLQYFLLLFGILAGIGTSKITTKFKFLILLIIILMIPTQAGLLKGFYNRPAFAKISASELEALNFVKNNTPKESVILTPPYNQYLNLGGVTPNIWDWSDTSYVAAFSGRRTYMDDSEQADIMGYDYNERLEIKKIIFESTDIVKVKEVLSLTGIDIVYYPKAMAPKIDLSTVGLTKIFDNQLIEVWKAS